MPTWISHEPVVWVNAVSALIGVGVLFFPGLLTPEQKAAIIIAIPLIGNLIVTRQAVTPNAKVNVKVDAAVAAATANAPVEPAP